MADLAAVVPDKTLAQTSIRTSAGSWKVSLSGHRREAPDIWSKGEPATVWVFTLRVDGKSTHHTMQLVEFWTPGTKWFGPLLAPFESLGRQMLLVRIPGMTLGAEGSVLIQLYDVNSDGTLTRRLQSEPAVYYGGSCVILDRVRLEVTAGGSSLRLRRQRKNTHPKRGPREGMSQCEEVKSGETVADFEWKDGCYVDQSSSFGTGDPQACLPLGGLVDCSSDPAACKE